MESIAQIIKATAQIVVALGIFNVWLLRFNRPTQWRGGAAKDLKEEFRMYGLPPFVFYLVGSLKIVGAILLIVGFFVPSVVMPAALLIAFLMAGAVMMHLKVNDPILRALPAVTMLVLSLLVAFL